MTLESRQYAIWRRLGRRFLLEDQPPGGPGAAVGTAIIPVTSADDLLRVPEIQQATVDIQAAAGAFVTFFTVPAGERWHLRTLWREGTTAESNVAVRAPGSADIALLGVAGTGEVTVLNPGIIEEAWNLGMLSTGNAGDAARTLRALIDRDIAF